MRENRERVEREQDPYEKPAEKIQCRVQEQYITRMQRRVVRE